VDKLVLFCSGRRTWQVDELGVSELLGMAKSPWFELTAFRASQMSWLFYYNISIVYWKDDDLIGQMDIGLVETKDTIIRDAAIQPICLPPPEVHNRRDMENFVKFEDLDCKVNWHCIFQFLFFWVKKYLRIGSKIFASKPSQPLIFCRSKGCLGWVGSQSIPRLRS